jgi:hypothetical protein
LADTVSHGRFIRAEEKFMNIRNHYSTCSAGALSTSTFSSKVLCTIIACILLILFCASAALWAQAVDGIIESGEYANTRTTDGGNYTLSWRVEGSVIYFAMSAETEGWVAVGFDPITVMDNADMVFGSVDKNMKVTVTDMHSIGVYGPHPPDVSLGGTDDILEYAGSEKDGATTIEFSRLLVTGDVHDQPLSPDLGNKVIWAYSLSDDFSKPHKVSGSSWKGRALRIRSGLPLTVILPIHYSSMSLAFAIMAFIGYIARYEKGKRWWLKTHRALGVAAASIGVFGIGTAVYMVSITTGMHIRVVHSYFGLLSAAVLITSPILGFGFLKGKKERKLLYRKLHRWIGRIALLMILATIVLGLFQAGIL